MTVTVSKPAFNLRETLTSLKRKIGLKGAEIMRANTVDDVYSVIGKNRNIIINGEPTLMKDFVKRMKFKGPVYEISALTREGCEPLIKDIYKHIQSLQVAEMPPEEVDPRFDRPAPDDV